jgi:hypothetical protein
MILDPDYARIFTQARIVAWQYGFACLAHGSFTRDLDLLLVPWADRSLPDVDLVVKRIAGVAGLQVQGPPSEKPHGRRAWTLLLPGFGEVRWVDLSAFVPSVDTARQRWRHTKTGGVYEFVAEAMNEADASVVIVYRNVETGVTWVRAASEFFDGRFDLVGGEQP